MKRFVLSRSSSSSAVPVFRILALLSLFAVTSSAWAGTSGNASLFTPATSGRASNFGDYITTSTGGLNTVYHYFIEVPPGLGRLRVQLFDADMLQGGAGEPAAGRDKNDGSSGVGTAVYTLIRPDASTAATLTCTTAAGSCTSPTYDNAWVTLQDSSTAQNTAAGHWELRLNMASATGSSYLNGFGLRADDGDDTAGGTELNVYYDSHTNIGLHTDMAADTRSYTAYPWITSGCTFNENDFDYDTGGGNTGNGTAGSFGSVALTSRSTAITRTVASAALSANNVWAHNVLARWGTDNASQDYGIWRAVETISTFVNGTTQNNNYTNIWFGNDQAVATGIPTANPTANAFRVYLPTDGGTAPVKPYIEQFIACIPASACGVAPAVGTQREYRITIRLVNPSGAGSGTITFSNTNVVTARIPAAPVQYRQGVIITQGAIVAQPALNGSNGDVTWNPGTVTAGTTALLSYVIRINPVAGRNLVTGTPAGNGTRATWLDHTGLAAQARATYSTGGLCELAITTNVITPAIVSGLTARATDAGTEVEWTTASEVGTTGFDLYRFDRASRSYERVTARPVAALITAPQGGVYRLLDDKAPAAGLVRYKLVELLSDGNTRDHGPYRVMVERRLPFEKRAAEAGLIRSAWTPVAAPDLQTEDGPSDVPPRHKAGAPTALKLGVRDTGLYRMSSAALATQFGISAAQAQGYVTTRGWKLTNRGVEVPWFGTADGFVFYGRAVDSQYARDNVYRLTLAAAAAVSEVSAGNPLAPVADASFAESTHLEQDRFAATVVASDPNSDYWYWDFLVAGDASLGTKSFTLDAPGLGSGGAQLSLDLQGATKSGITGEHHATVRVNGSDVGSLQWTGIAPQSATFNLPAGLLQESGNTVEVTGLLDAGAPQSVFYVDGFNLAYTRHLRASGDALAFKANGAGSVTVGGFSGTGVTLLDVTQPERPSRINGALASGTSDVSVTLVASSAATRYFAAGPSAVKTPVWTKVDTPSTLRSPRNGADYLVVTASSFLAPAADLASFRASQGLLSQVVDIEDVYDEFGDGIPNPKALADFFAYARTKWSPTPRFAVLAGGGNYDYRDILALGGNIVPPLMAAAPEGGLFASDYSFVPTGDKGSKTQLAIGRLPATSAAALQAYVDKLRAYENGAAGIWGLKALVLADAEPGNDFLPNADRMAGLLPPEFAPQRIYLSQEALADARSRLFSELASGAGVVNYVGHGALDRLSAQGLLTSGDVPAMTGGVRTPLFTAFTCIINRFDVPGFSPLGAVMAAAQNGGAIAVFAPTGLNDNAQGSALGEAFYQEFGRTPVGGRLGDIVQRAISSFLGSGGSLNQAAVYTLLGDPALRLQRGVLPVAPPGVPGGGPNG